MPTIATALKHGQDIASDDLRTILVVDDSRAQRRLLGMMLKNWGYRVLEAKCGEDALSISARDAPDLVISDWMMPGLTGPEFCAAFRRQPNQEYAYFVLLTSKTDSADMAAGLELGADDFLTKPVDKAELRARLIAGERIVKMHRELSEKNTKLNGVLHQLRQNHDSMKRDSQEARRFQLSLMPERHLRFGDTDITTVLRPCGHVGGDMVGAFEINCERIGFYSLDVSGHGVASGLVAARMASYLSGSSPDRNVALTQTAAGCYAMHPPEHVAARLNELMLDEFNTDLYLTMFLADLDLTNGQMRFVQAGHPHPYVLRRGGAVSKIGSGGLPIGLVPGATYEAVKTRLNPGDRFLVYSDGVSEAANAQHVEFGDSALESFLLASTAVKPTDFLDRLIETVNVFTGQVALLDDVSALLVCRSEFA